MNLKQIAKKLRANLAIFIYPELLDERRCFERRIQTDPLTGLGNKQAFKKSIETLRPDQTVVLFDLNNLGKANKISGHTLGDQLILKAATAIASQFPRAFRFGGDEFAAIAPLENVETAIKMVEGAFWEQPIDGTNDFVSLTGSFGETFEEADRLLQPLKRNRKARPAFAV